MREHTEPLLFELSRTGRTGHSVPELDVPQKPKEEMLPENILRKNPPELPELSEPDVVRHYTKLSQLNHAVDTGFYPLGSCTMKYNPRINEEVSQLPGFSQLHPLQPVQTVQGALELLFTMEKFLCELSGMTRFTFQPAAGAHGEFTGLSLIRAYHNHKGDNGRTKIIIPDSAHGTNPASVAMAGYKTVQVKSNDRGGIDLEHLREIADDTTAGLMLTNPNTLGIFDENITQIAEIVHNAGGLLYYDGANANAIMGISRPADMGFDIVHFNLHKTFSTPHGGGGPGSGPVGVVEKLVPFLPVPVVEKRDYGYYLDYDRPESIGKIHSFYGNFGVVIKAYAYILSMGMEGLRRASEEAVLNANYMMRALAKYFHLPYDRTCMHEFVLSGSKQKEMGIRTLDMAKRLPDFGFHPPTVYFPLIVEEAMMIEPTETESKETLDAFIEAMKQIAREAEENPDMLKNAPHTTPVRRLDETRAARQPDLRWRP
ncbi:MAG TPA: aminomethyl-transferring glycine dehydrogenase subunit GcvPB, partial [Clostridia bacterium]|jgi:glycine dehydrogenase subunit 2|nr:aminomethyl-transferring glycine dehydrogenase subunit GcvPB [Clostridia bacterium]